MKFAFEVGHTERHRVEFSRSAMWGTMSIEVDGQQVATQSAGDLGTHFNLSLVKEYTFTVGVHEFHEVTIKHERPAILAGFRPHTYRVLVDGKLVEAHVGY